MQKHLRIPCFGKFIQQDSSPPENPLYRWDKDLLPTFSPFKKLAALLAVRIIKHSCRLWLLLTQGYY